MKKTVKDYEASQQRIQIMLEKLLNKSWVNKPFEMLSEKLTKWQAKVGTRTRNIWIISIFALIFLYGIYTLIITFI